MKSKRGCMTCLQIQDIPKSPAYWAGHWLGEHIVVAEGTGEGAVSPVREGW